MLDIDRRTAITVAAAVSTGLVMGYAATASAYTSLRLAPSSGFTKYQSGSADGIQGFTGGGYNGSDQAWSLTGGYYSNIDYGWWEDNFSTERATGETRAYISTSGIMTGRSNYLFERNTAWFNGNQCFNQNAYANAWALVFSYRTLKGVGMDDQDTCQVGGSYNGPGAKKVGWDELKVYY